VSCVRLDGTDGRLFGMELAGGELSWWVILVIIDGTDADCLVGSCVGRDILLGELLSDLTDGRLFGWVLGVLEISCWLSWVRLEGTDV
jgi:hypothetical protein